MTKEEYIAVCGKLQIEFRESIRAADPEQLALKAQLLQKYHHNARAITQACNISPEITVYSNGRVVSVSFLDDTNYVFWMDDVFPNFPKLKKIPKYAGFYSLEQIMAKTEQIIGSN